MPETNSEKKAFVDAAVGREAAALTRVAEALWNNPELSYEEKESSALQKRYCRERGFRVTELDGVQRYAFTAEWGSGRPVIGLLGEFDALPGLSQKVQTTREPVTPGAPGHGCGHNLLGTALMGAAAAVKEAIDAGRLSGTIRYFGAPAEEQLGKPVLARAGVFDGLDAALGYHPSDLNCVAAFGTNASVEITFSFHGKPAHAAQVPHLGRSALDALTLTQVGCEFLREHIPTSARIHYIVTSGGMRANIVPDAAAGEFQIRSPAVSALVPVVKRVLDVARGAALMTGTTFDFRVKYGCYDVLPNKALGAVLEENLNLFPPPAYDEAEIDFCRKISDTSTAEQKRTSLLMLGVDPASVEALLPEPVHTGRGVWGEGWTIPASTDVGDVSHIAPLAQVYTAAFPMGVGSHTWQATAAAGSTVGMKGMLYAARIFAGASWDLMTRPAALDAARTEWQAATGGAPYRPLETLIAEISS